MNGDDTLDWAKKPAVPDNRKRAVSKKTIEGSPVSRYCPKCAIEGTVSPIHLFQINDDEAVLMCKNASCTFMQSTYWQSLIVKRSVSQLSVRSQRKSLSGSSRLSTPSNRNTGTRLQSILKSACQSRYGVPFNSSSSSSPGISPLPSLAGVSVASSHPAVQRYTTSTTQQESDLEGKERKTLVPIAPFLNGHAHNFASFETNKLEHRLQQRVQQQQQKSSPALSPKDTRIPFVREKQTSPGKRRTNSLDSDSHSSSSSCYDSRPTTPEAAPGGKKVKSIVVAPETLSKLIDGSMRLEIRRSKTSGSDIIFRSVKKVNGTNGYSKHTEVDSNKTQRVNLPVPGTLEPAISAPTVNSIQEIYSDNLDITPVGSLDDLVTSGDPQPGSASSHIEAINFHLQATSIKSHIEIINSHIQAINRAVGCSDLYNTINFSHLCQKFRVDNLNEAASSQGSDKSSSVSTSDHSEFIDSSPTDCISIIPVGYLDQQDAGARQVSAGSSYLTPGNATFEGLEKLQAHTSSSSQFGDTQLSHSCS